MRIVVADTGPLNYLLLIGAIDLLPKLFETVLVPETVRAELCHPGASALVRIWADRPPAWIEVLAGPAFAVTGTLGVLDRAARRGLIDLAAALTRLKATNFRCRPEIMDALLAQHTRRET